MPQPTFDIQPFNLEKATPLGQADILALNKELRGGKADPDFPTFVRKNLHESVLLVGRVGGRIKATIIVDKQRKHVHWIRHNVVASDAPRIGLGQSMLASAIEESRRSGARKIYLTCNNVPSRDRARAAYAKAGFVLANPVYESLKDADGAVVYAQLFELSL